MVAMGELIRLEDIHFSYPGQQPLLKGVNLTLAEGQRLGITGPNGAGKSTLLLVAMGLVIPDSGRVYWRGKECKSEEDFRELRREVGLCFQDPDDQLFCPTVLEDVAFGPMNLMHDRSKAVEVARATLERLDLSHLASRPPYHLSGGEKRLVALATVLAMNPKALLLDEPTAALAPETAARVEQLLVSSDLGWIIVSHDIPFLSRTCEKLLYMDQGVLQAPPQHAAAQG